MKHGMHVVLAAVLAAAADSQAGTPAKRFEWTTKSPEAKKLLADVQTRIENFQFGPATAALAEKLVAADPKFAIGVYYLSATTPPPANEKHLARATELAKTASEGERRFIEAMVVARANQGASFKDAIPHLEKLAADYPEERLLRVILGQLYQGANQAEKALAAFQAAERIGPPSNRVRAFLANDALIKGDYGKARRTLLEVEKSLPKGAAPFAVRYGVTFSHLYEGDVEAAVDSLKTYLAEYKDSGSAQGFPEVFIWNSIARIYLENGRLEEAMKAYESGYAVVPASSLPEDQKQLWLGRLHHGRCRVLAKMGKHEEAWAGAQRVKAMIDEAGEQGKQYLPAYHYLAGYLKLEAGDFKAAVAELKQSNPEEPVPQPAAGARLREAGREGERPRGVPRGARVAAERPGAGARLPGGQAQARGLRPAPRESGFSASPPAPSGW
jgi:tetratricopeptide (TPR) repeat protein